MPGAERGTSIRKALRSTVAALPGARPGYRAVLEALRALRGPFGSFLELSPARQVELAYEVVLGRPVDPGGRRTALELLNSADWTPRDLVAWLMSSGEFRRSARYSERMLGPSLHASRCQFVRSLPEGRRIVDLGGTDLGSPAGAMVSMGYPYSFDSLVIIDLPPEERHPIYQVDHRADRVVTDLGTVEYRYHSMSDLSAFADAGVDLVYCGQSIEHVAEEEALKVLRSAFRILVPGGFMAIDTPNARVTRIQQDHFIDPDHKVEYTLDQLSSLVTAAGFDIVECKGANWARASVTRGRFDAADTAANGGLYWAAEECYLLCLVLRKPL